MRICIIYNFAQHYRTNIFTLIDKYIDVDFYFGNTMYDVKKMDYTLLGNSVTELSNHKLGPIEWQSGAVQLAFKKYDVYLILAGPMTLSTWLTTILCRLQRKKVVFWSHGWYGKEKRWQILIKKVFFRLPNHTLLYGNYAKELMRKNGFNTMRLTVIHNSLIYDSQIEIRRSIRSSHLYFDHFQNSNPNIVFVGRLTPVKNLDILLRAQSISILSGFKFNVTFIGDGTERIHLQEMVNEYNLSSLVWFYGPTYDENELSQMLYDADVCVAPGNIGLTAMHAMVYGCPCISHDDFAWQMPEFEAIVPGKTGQFFKKDSEEDLAKVIKKWLVSNSGKRDVIRSNCYSEIDNHWNPHIQLDIIQSVLNKI